MTAPSRTTHDVASALGLGRPDLLETRARIGADWIEPGAEAIAVRDPARSPGDPRAVLAHVPALGAPETEAAVMAAAAALGPWRARTAKDRARILRAWFDAIERHADDLARILTAEQGKPLAEARGEILYAAAFVEWFAEEARRIYGDTIPGHQPDKRLLVLRQPVGVVGAVTPWNFPAAMITRKVAPALAAGCTFVLKPSELTPLTALALTRLAVEAGVPDGVLNVVTGAPAPIGAVLTGHPIVRKFSFTGSTAVGKLLTAQCATTVKRVSMELGGNAPLIVFDDADLDTAVEGAIVSKFRNTGQTCVCANRILVQDGIHDAFAERLSARVGRLVVGPGLEGPTDQGPLINDQALAKVEGHVADALAKGGTLIAGGRRHARGGLFYEPTIIAGATPDMRLAREETFGPVAALFRFKTEAEAVALANDTPAGLAAYAFTRDLARFWRVSEALDYGMVGINTGLISTEVVPFGGMKESGLGREGSRYGIEEYLEMKMVCVGGVV